MNPRPTRQIDDAVLAANVRQAFDADADLRTADISIDARSGIVTLRGRVRSATVRARAESIARGVAGVSEVVNQLTAP